jgi:hypothetical protein
VGSFEGATLWAARRTAMARVQQTRSNMGARRATPMTFRYSPVTPRCGSRADRALGRAGR